MNRFDMAVVLKKTSNDKFKDFVGKKGVLKIGTHFRFYNCKFGYLQSSYIKSIIFKRSDTKNKVKIRTRNSTYVFLIL